MTNYTKPTIDRKRIKPSVAIPDQSLSIQQIVQRYVRGLPVDVLQRKPIYIDQDEHDLEQLSRLDFGEKAELAIMLAHQAKALKDDLAEFESQRKLAIKTANAAKRAKLAKNEPKTAQDTTG